MCAVTRMAIQEMQGTALQRAISGSNTRQMPLPSEEQVGVPS